MQKSTKSKPPPRKEAIDWAYFIHKNSGVLVKFAGLGFLACMGYYMYAIYGGDLLQSADSGRAYYLVAAFGQGLVLASFLLALGLMIMTLDELAYAIVVGLGGLALMFGVPYMVAGNLANVGGDMQRVTERMSRSGTEAGMAVLLVVGLRIIYEIYLQIKDAPVRRQAQMEKEAAEDAGILKKKKTIKPTTTLSPCWELPFCHDRIKEICPAFKARKTCWRFHSGCNCDPRLIERLIRAGAPGKGPKSDEQKRTEGAYIRSDLDADLVNTESVERTIPCTRCPIYNEHQRLKFKFVIPVSILATLVGMGILYQPISAIWDFIAGKIVVGMAAVALGEVKATEWFGYLQDDVVRIAFFIVLCLLALSYVLRFTEWAVLTRKVL